MTVRLDVILSDKSAETLKAIADERGINATEAIRQAIAWYKFIDDEVIKKNQELQLVETNWRGKTIAITTVVIGADN